MEAFRDSKILVTGGAGFVGGNLVRRLLGLDTESIHVVDNLLSAERSNVPDDLRVKFTEGSISSDTVLAELSDDYDYVFEQLKSFKRLKRVVYSGAGCAVAEKTFDEAHATLEDAPISLRMDSPYSISKIVGEFYALYYFDRHGLPTVRARFQNVYGPGEILGAGQWRGTPATVWRNVTPTFVYRALKGLPLPVEGEGQASRDFIYVQDIVTGLLLCATNGASGEVYNLASGVETSILDLAQSINNLTGNPAPIEFRPRRDWDHSGRRFGSTEKSKRELGFEAQTPLHEGLEKTVAWTRENMDMIEACIQKHAERMEMFA
jgi:nucleoside-diphosphate-sugar epimerase